MKRTYAVLIFFATAVSCNHKMEKVLSKEIIDGGPAYSNAVSVTCGHTKTMDVAGLTGEGADLETQTRSTFAHIKTVLEKAGTGLTDMVKTNVYIPDYTPENMDIFRRIGKEILGDTNMPASTAIGVSVLAAKGKLIEIEAVAVIQTKN